MRMTTPLKERSKKISFRDYKLQPQLIGELPELLLQLRTREAAVVASLSHRQQLLREHTKLKPVNFKSSQINKSLIVPDIHGVTQVAVVDT